MPAELKNYLPQFCDALLKRQATSRTVEAFKLYWMSLSHPMQYCPCPFCFAVGQQGRMVEQTQNHGVLPLQCETCGEQILIRLIEPPPAPPSERRSPREP